MELLKPDDLTLDLAIYPRPYIDDAHVLSLREVLKAGGDFDPILIGRPGMLIVDGGHRWMAWKEEKPGQPIPAVVRTYDGKKAMLADAIKYNIRHGKRLDADAFRTCFERATELGMQRSEVVCLLGITKEFATGLLGSRPVGASGLSARAPAPLGFNPLKNQERATTAGAQSVAEVISRTGDYSAHDDPTIGDRWAGLAVGQIARLMSMFKENEGKEIPDCLMEAMNELISYWQRATK